MRCKLKTWLNVRFSYSVLISLILVYDSSALEPWEVESGIAQNALTPEIYYKRPSPVFDKTKFGSRQGFAAAPAPRPQNEVTPASIYWVLDEVSKLSVDSSLSASETQPKYAHVPAQPYESVVPSQPYESVVPAPNYLYPAAGGLGPSHVASGEALYPINNAYQTDDYGHTGSNDALNEVHTDSGLKDLVQVPEYAGLLVIAVVYFLAALLLKGSVVSSLSKSTIPCLPVPGLNFYEAKPFDVQPISDSSLLQEKMLDMFYGESDASFEIPDMSQVAGMCPSDGFFYGSNRRHMMAVDMVKSMFMGQKSADDMYSMALALRHSPQVHPRVWYEGLMHAAADRKDMGGMVFPGPIDIFPDSFIPSEAYARGLSRSLNVKGRSHKKQECVKVDGSAGVDNGHENRLWYFREDVMVNSHHWYWHMAYPLMSKNHGDRRGELFYITHHHMLARYNIERICNGMPIAPKMTNLQPGNLILPPYNAHLDDTNSGKRWTDRHPITPFLDIHHERNKNMPQTILLSNWAQNGVRIGTAVAEGYLINPEGKRVYIPGYDGIDLVGNTLEATSLSFNPDYYDMVGYHNMGHAIIGLSGDPNYVLKLPPGPMGDTATSMRDPIFYHWHTNTDLLFDDYKKTLPPYQPYGGEFPLVWDGVHINQFRVLPYNGQKNVLTTFFTEKKYELGLGLAFDRNGTQGHDGHLSVCHKHLDHQEFDYQLDIEVQSCVKTKSGTGTVRIFIAPKYDEKKNKLLFSQQRRLFVALDAFTIPLKPGKNLITRRSIDSSLTAPYAKSLQQLKEDAATPGPAPAPHCGCGWPHHLLIPKGHRKGKLFDLFAMVTNGDEDLVEDPKAQPETCNAAPIICGIPNRRYPDARPMGYPFDRYPYSVNKGRGLWDKVTGVFGKGQPVETIEEYVTGIPNMGLTQIKIIHNH